MQHALAVGVGDGRVDAHAAGTHAVLEVEHAGLGAFVPEVEGFLGGEAGGERKRAFMGFMNWIAEWKKYPWARGRTTVPGLRMRVSGRGTGRVTSPPRDRSRGAWSGWDCSGSDYACASIAAKRAAGHCLRSETWPSPSSIRRNSPLVDSTTSTEKNGQSIRCATCSTSGGTVSRRP